MTDAEIRGWLLMQFHQLRHSNGGWVPISDMNLVAHPVDLRVIGGVCQQLADVGLIQWKPLQDSKGIVAGTGKITGQGVAAIESDHSTVIDIRFPLKGDSTTKQDSLLGGPLETARALGVVPMKALGAGIPSSPTSSNLPASRERVTAFAEQRTELLTLKPTLWGISIDLKEAGRRLLSWWRKLS